MTGCDDIRPGRLAWIRGEMRMDCVDLRTGTQGPQMFETSVLYLIDGRIHPALLSNALARAGIHHEIHNEDFAANTDRIGIGLAVLSALGLG